MYRGLAVFSSPISGYKLNIGLLFSLEAFNIFELSRDQVSDFEG